MKNKFSICSLVFLFSINIFAIGSQHGVFRSQSTQGTPWQGTATITSEQFNITVMPDYLDVELEWTFEVGGAAPTEYSDALEIVGNLNLEANSVVVGMITWYKGLLLKGKLKTEDVARAQYEDVVERDADRPPPPRDPVLLEYGWGEDNYDISIFPVTFGGTRKIRIRYLIPAFNINGVNKISFPNAFTGNATVSIQAGTGVDAYTVETDRDNIYYTSKSLQPLDTGEFLFQAYGSSGRKRITHIVPVLTAPTDGSTMYSGSFSTATFSGEMIHVTTMTPEKALLKSTVAEDFVILWRWNHPKVLELYARQIVEQSKLLTRFLASLESANKRAALIISKEGGESVTFTLDRKDGSEFNRMIAYLDGLSAQAIIDPPMSSTQKNPELQYEASLALQEFEDALKQAMALFEKNDVSLKHLLVLTAGPQLAFTYVTNQDISWDSTIDVNLLNSYFSEKDLGPDITLPFDEMYWPGVDLSGFIRSHRSDWNVSATVGNSVDTFRIEVLTPPSADCSYCSWKHTTEMHLYSSSPLQKVIRWSVNKGGRQIAAYTESPRVVELDDGMQYARLIGASKYLVPLAGNMPSSMASTLGFIDTKYSLVALEEDALPDSIARNYEEQGVPLLYQADIFPADDERSDVPVEDWLVAHPPVSMSRDLYSNVYSWGDIRWIGVEDMISSDKTPDLAVNEPADPNVAVRAGVPQVAPLYSSTQNYPDYSEALAIGPKQQQKRISGKLISVKRGFLFVDLTGLGIDKGKSVSISIFDISGRIIYRWNGRASLLQENLALVCKKFANGTYLINIRSGVVNYNQQVIFN